MTGQNSSVFLFDDVRVEPSNFRVFKGGKMVQLEPKALSLLLFLIENPGRLIEKDEILDRIWSGAFVTENALAREIAKLRKTLGDDPKAARYIQTVHTRGYRFIAEVKQSNGVTGISNNEERPAVAAAEAPSDLKLEEGAGSWSPIDVRGSVRLKALLTSRKAVALSSLIVISLLTAGMLWKRHLRLAPPATTSIFSVAVLPFKMSGDAQNNENFGVEIADALTKD